MVFKKMYYLTFSFQPSFFIYKPVHPKQMTNRWIDWGNKLSWRFVPGRATEEHTFTYSLQMAPNAVTQEFNLCQLPSIWPEITLGPLVTARGRSWSLMVAPGQRDWSFKGSICITIGQTSAKHSESPFHLSLDEWTWQLPGFLGPSTSLEGASEIFNLVTKGKKKEFFVKHHLLT